MALAAQNNGGATAATRAGIKNLMARRQLRFTRRWLARMGRDGAALIGERAA